MMKTHGSARPIPEKTLRASYNKYHDLWAESGLDPLPFPTQVMISSALLAAFVEANKDDYVGGLAGQVSGIIHEIKPAKTVVEEMVAETVDILSRKLPETVRLKSGDPTLDNRTI